MTQPFAIGRRLWAHGFGRVGLVLGVLLGLAVPHPAGAQSAYVPLDDVAYVYIDALIARGDLRGLSLLERPYTVEAVRQALRARPRQVRSAGLQDLHDRLERAIAKYALASRRRGIVRAEVSAGLWVTGETSGQRELMLADEMEPSAFAGGAARFLLTAGPVVAFSRPILENRLNSDPDFQGRKDRRIAGRNEDAYLAGQWRYGELFFGRTVRNWGPTHLQGLMLGGAPYSYDHAFGRLGTQRLNLSLLLARLDDDSLGDGRAVQRHVAMHRLSARWRWLEAAVAEAFVYSGIGRGFEPTLANPLSLYALTWRNERPDGNLLGSVQLAARTRYGVFSGEALLDDIQLDRCDTLCEQPASWGLTLTGDAIPLPWGHRGFMSYTRVSSLTYRNKNDPDRYTHSAVSLGRAFSDYDEVRLGIDIVPFGAALRPYVAYRRQGEGDYRLPFPPPEEYATHPAIFEGARTRVARAAIAGGMVLGAFDLRGDVGYNWVRNPAAPAEFRTAGQLFRPVRDSFEGRVRLAWNPRWARVRLAP